MKIISKILFFSAIAFSLAPAAHGKKLEENFEQAKPESIITVFEKLDLEKIPKSLSNEAEVASKENARAPAPPLSSVSIYAVGSSNCGWEYLPGNTTSCDHGGFELRVAVLENGYSSNRIAWMNGALLPASANYASEGICVVNGVATMPCPIGYSITSWMRYYNLDGKQSGFFQYQASSANPPFNTFSTSVSIK